MELYVAGIGGVYQYAGSSGTTDFVRMAGMEDLNTSGNNLALVSVALGVGGTADDLTALVKVYHALGGDQGGTTTYEVRWYNTAEGKWETKNTIPKDMRPSTNGEANKVLILSSDEIWTQNAYYDGTEWTLLSGLRLQLQCLREGQRDHGLRHRDRWQDLQAECRAKRRFGCMDAGRSRRQAARFPL